MDALRLVLHGVTVVFIAATVFGAGPTNHRPRRRAAPSPMSPCCRR